MVSVGNQNVFFYHEHAFLDSARVMENLRSRFESVCQAEFAGIRVANAEVPHKDAVDSYLFNSQLLTLSPGKMCLIAPTECQEIESVRLYLQKLLASGKTPIREVRYFDLRQSMHNGGGPACLRLRTVLTDKEIAGANAHAFMNDRSFALLKTWVEKHYRDRLTPKDLADPQLLIESRTALDELTKIMHLGSVYSFQR